MARIFALVKEWLQELSEWIIPAKEYFADIVKTPYYYFIEIWKSSQVRNNEDLLAYGFFLGLIILVFGLFYVLIMAKKMKKFRQLALINDRLLKKRHYDSYLDLGGRFAIAIKYELSARTKMRGENKELALDKIGKLSRYIVKKQKSAGGAQPVISQILEELAAIIKQFENDQKFERKEFLSNSDGYKMGLANYTFRVAKLFKEIEAKFNSMPSKINIKTLAQSRKLDRMLRTLAENLIKHHQTYAGNHDSLYKDDSNKAHVKFADNIIAILLPGDLIHPIEWPDGTRLKLTRKEGRLKKVLFISPDNIK